MHTTDSEIEQHVYSVSQLTRETKGVLESEFPQVWVEGEISNFSAPGSGHWYFSLKDTGSQVRCAMFRGQQRKLTFTPKDGSHILVRARVTMYEARGEFQLVADHMEERGEGKLRAAYEVLKKKLEALGLFNAEHKKPLPEFPKQIGVVTSATGAAIRDVLTVLKRRYPAASVIIYPTLVQGATAAPTIAQAIETANRRNECDVLIVTRGGGSLEDLWPFNEEIVAQAIYRSVIPIISGVGHEVDFTIADFVADKRAATPSAAAEIITPDRSELLQILHRHQQHLLRCIKHKIETKKQQVAWMDKHLAQQHPKRRLTEKMQRLDFCEVTLVKLQHQKINQLRTKLSGLDKRLHQLIPTQHIQRLQNQLNLQQQKLTNLIGLQINKKKTMLANVAAKLDGLSPLATLQRGYAIASSNQHVLRNAAEVKVGDVIHLQLQSGSLDCTVNSIK